MNFYVATLSSYVIVEAIDEADARELGHAALERLFAGMGHRVAVDIRVVRPATDDEVKLDRWQREASSEQQQTKGDRP